MQNTYLVKKYMHISDNRLSVINKVPQIWDITGTWYRFLANKAMVNYLENITDRLIN
jgi:hypothetical protein